MIFLDGGISSKLGSLMNDKGEKDWLIVTFLKWSILFSASAEYDFLPKVDSDHSA